MATYYFAVAFQSNDPISEDGTHLEAQYGFGVDSGSGVTALGSSGSQGRQFESVSIPASSGGPPNQLVVSLFSDILGIDQSRSFFRCTFRPAHDVPPSNGLPLAPLNQGDAQNLLGGIFLAARNTQNASITSGSNYGLPQSSYETQWVFTGANFIGGQPAGTSLHFEISIEISIVGAGGSTWSYYKVDPEMQIDF
jgi:hypothetical protein